MEQIMEKVSEERVMVHTPSGVWARVKKDAAALVLVAMLFLALGGGAAWVVGRIDRMEDRLVRRIDGVEDRIGGLENRIGGLEDRIGGLENRIGGLENQIGVMENRIGVMENQIGGLVADMAKVKERLAHIEGWIEGRFNRPPEAEAGAEQE